MPSNPNIMYKDVGWQGWGHWLGSSNHLAKPGTLFLPFEEALAVARSLGLASSMEWKMWSKEGMRPRNVPSAPDEVYKCRGWQGWGHWLGSGDQHTKVCLEFLPFEEALAAARSLGLASAKAWHAWCKVGTRPHNLPSNPHRTYKHGGWRGWGHWLGTGNTPGGQLVQDSLPFEEKSAMTVDTARFLPFGEALAVARSLGLASLREWEVWSDEQMRPPNIPTQPDKVYEYRGWQGWGHWLETGNAPHARLQGARVIPQAAWSPPPSRTCEKAVGTPSTRIIRTATLTG